MAKADNQKAGLVVALDKEVAAAKTLEEKLSLCIGAIDTAESFEAHARAVIHEVVKDLPEDAIFELGGLPYKKAVVRTGKAKKGEEGYQERYTIRCGIPAGIRAAYDFEKKTANSP